MFYNNKVVTLGNYEKIFEGYSPDVLDEIRLAVLDDTAISKFINPCKDDSYRLGQIRLALREYVPVEYISSSISGENMFLIRKCIREGVNISSIRKYIRNGGLSVSNGTLNEMLKALSKGADISKVDFTVIADGLVKVVCVGLQKNYPMWLFESEVLSESRVMLLMRGMSLGIDIQPLINSDWSDECIRYIFLSAKQVDTELLLSVVTPKFNVEHLKEVIFAITNNLDYTLIAKRSKDGTPVYNEYQMEALNLAMVNGVLTEDMCNEELDDREIRRMTESAIVLNKDKERVLGGTLPKRK